MEDNKGVSRETKRGVEERTNKRNEKDKKLFQGQMTDNERLPEPSRIFFAPAPPNTPLALPRNLHWSPTCLSLRHSPIHPSTPKIGILVQQLTRCFIIPEHAEKIRKSRFAFELLIYVSSLMMAGTFLRAGKLMSNSWRESIDTIPTEGKKCIILCGA